MRFQKVLHGILFVAFFLFLFQSVSFFARSFFRDEGVCNVGGAFGFVTPPLFIVFLSAVVLSFFLYEWGREKNVILEWTWLFVIVAGLSNFTERIVFGCVFDYISLSFLPLFNLADLVLTIGVFVFLWQTIRRQG